MSKILIMISGLDRPGITSQMMDIVIQANSSVLDVGQSVTHGFLSLNFLLNMEGDIDSTIGKLCSTSRANKLNLDYKKVPDNFSSQSIEGEKFTLTCVAYQPIPTPYIQEVARILAHHNANILRIDNLSPPTFSSLKIDTILLKGTDSQPVKKDLLKISNYHSIDAAFIKDSIYRHNKRLVAFDMDSTLIQNEVINDLAEKRGRKEEIKTITEKAMRGEINFEQSLRQRTRMLEGLSQKDMEEVSRQMVLTPGCSELIRVLKHLGYKTALISGGFSFFTEKLKESLDLDYHFANTLEVVDGKVSGRLSDTLVTPKQKAELLKQVALRENISLKQTVAIGDGANDIPMLNTAGLGIAYQAKEIVRRSAPHIVNHGPLTSILYFLGISPSALEEASP